MFLDDEPYIRYWKPTYRIVGPIVRPLKASILGVLRIFHNEGERHFVRIESQIEGLEASQQALYGKMEVLAASLPDRQMEARLAAIESQIARLLQTDFARLEERLNSSAAGNQQLIQNYFVIMEQMVMSFLSDRDTQTRLDGLEERLVTAIAGSIEALALLQQQCRQSLAVIEARCQLAITEGRCTDLLKDLTIQLTRDNADQWSAIERLILAFLAGTSKTVAVPNSDLPRQHGDNAIGVVDNSV